MNRDDHKMKFSAVDGNHILQPQNEISTIAQNATFKLIEDQQEELINIYEGLSDDEKFLRANALARLFVDVLMNGDQASFKVLIGTGGRLMNAEELKNIRKDLEIAKEKKKLGEYKMFLLLDLFPYSNRRADAIIVSNNYKIELYDFSEGVVAEKLKNYQGNLQDLNDKERKQLNRKNKQQERVDSFRDKISMDSNTLENIIIDSDKVSVQYYDSKPVLFDFNDAYQRFLTGRRQRLYIPNSFCFLTKKEEHRPSDLFPIPLKRYIDLPHFTTEGRFIDKNVLKDIYKNDTSIVISKIYFFVFFAEYTCFEIIFIKRLDKDNLENQIKLIIDGKKKGVIIKDSRTGKSIPFTYTLLFKHTFMNMSLRSWCEYISAICNGSFDDKKFNQDSFYADKIKKGLYFFDV